MATKWQEAFKDHWITDCGYGRIGNWSQHDSTYFPMWWFDEPAQQWKRITTATGQLAHRRTLQAAMIEVERKLKALDQKVAA